MIDLRLEASVNSLKTNLCKESLRNKMIDFSKMLKLQHII